MLRHSNIGWRVQSHWSPASPTNWQGAVWSWDRSWSHLPPSKILRSSVTTTPWGCKICHSLQACPRGYFSVASSRRGPGPSIGNITQTSVLATPLGECAVPTNQPSTCLLGLKDKANVSNVYSTIFGSHQFYHLLFLIIYIISFTFYTLIHWIYLDLILEIHIYIRNF